MRTLLIDADILAYQVAAAGQRTTDWGDGDVTTHVEKLEDVTPILDHKLERLKEQLEADQYVICLSCPTEEGWRKKILPTYKAGRGPKPELLGPLKGYLRETYRTYEKPSLEADDVMGILSTHPSIIKGQKIIVSIDKDMKTIPGWLFNPDKDTKPRLISQEEADYWHLYQTICGDTADNYGGCPGAGPDKVDTIVKSLIGKVPVEYVFKRGPRKGTTEIRWERTPFLTAWEALVSWFTAQGLTEEDALIQAQVARICRHTDYDFGLKQVRLWSPPG